MPITYRFRDPEQPVPDEEKDIIATEPIDEQLTVAQLRVKYAEYEAAVATYTGEMAAIRAEIDEINRQLGIQVNPIPEPRIRE